MIARAPFDDDPAVGLDEYAVAMGARRDGAGEPRRQQEHRAHAIDRLKAWRGLAAVGFTKVSSAHARAPS